MRKVLLATTALVAMSVTAAQADVSISGFQQFEMKDDGATTTWDDDGRVKIASVNTTDSGLTISAVHELATHMNGLHSAASGSIDGSYLIISGDFGTFRAGNTHDSLDMMDGLYPATWDESGQSGAANGEHAIGGLATTDAARASLVLPSINGATIYGSSSAEGNFSGMGINYASGPFSVMYQSGTEGTADETMMAVNFTMSGLTVGFGAGDREPGAGAAKEEYSAMGAKYTVNDALKIYLVSQKKKGTEDATSMGGYYTVAPGLTVAAETSTDAADQNSTYAHVKVAF
jgi:hypothetical protein